LTNLRSDKPQRAPPHLLPDTDLCKFQGDELEIKSIVTCDHGDPHRLSKQFIIVAGKDSPGLVLKEVEVFGIGEFFILLFFFHRFL